MFNFALAWHRGLWEKYSWLEGVLNSPSQAGILSFLALPGKSPVLLFGLGSSELLAVLNFR